MRFCSPGSERWPGASWLTWPSWSQRKQSEWVCRHLQTWTEMTSWIFFFPLPLHKSRHLREPAWLSGAVIPVSVAGLTICLKSSFDCFLKHGQIKNTVIAGITWQDLINGHTESFLSRCRGSVSAAECLCIHRDTCLEWAYQAKSLYRASFKQFLKPAARCAYYCLCVWNSWPSNSCCIYRRYVDRDGVQMAYSRVSIKDVHIM